MTDSFAAIAESLMASDLSALPQAFTTVEHGQFYDAGSAVRTLGVPIFDRGGLLSTKSGRPALEYAFTYSVLSDYLDVEGLGVDPERARQRVVDDLLGTVSRSQLLLGLAVVSKVLDRPDLTAELCDAYERLLAPAPSARFKTSITNATPPRISVARQPLLGAFRMALGKGIETGVTAEIPPPLAALMLSHAIAGGFRHDQDADTERIGGLPARLAVEFVTNYAFNAGDDLVAVFDRTLRLWRDHGDLAGGSLGGQLPADILKEVTGLELEDMLTMAFAVLAHHTSWLPGQPVLLDPGLNPGMDTEKWEAFLAVVADTPDGLSAWASVASSDWDYLAFQASPVLRLVDGLLLLDAKFLVERVTSGLYWLVHDHLSAKDDQLRHRWTQVWGAMVEALAEEELQTLAPPLLGAGTTYYTEHDLGTAYGDGTPRVDAVIDGGDHLAAIEIVSGQLTVKTRVDGDPESFRADLEKIVFKKVRQLDGTSAKLVGESATLTGTDVGSRPVVPILVAGGGFPVNEITTSVILEYIAEKNLFAHPLVSDVSIIDLGELEMLEALAERGQDAIDLIARWRRSDHGDLSLRNWILREFGSDAAQHRAARIEPRVDELFGSMASRLGLQVETEPEVSTQASRARDGPEIP